jgi:MFS family permease
MIKFLSKFKIIFLGGFMSSLEKRNLVLYVWGRFVSILGSGIQAIAIPLFILDLTGSAKIMSTVTMFSLVPMLIMLPIAGVLGDRLNRKHIMVNMDFARGILIFIMSVVSIYGGLNITVLIIGQIILAVLDAIFNYSTGSVMLPDLVRSDDLRKANSLVSSFDWTARILGPAVGGLIYSAVGISGVFLINAVSFVLSAISEIFIVYKRPVIRDKKLSVKIFFEDIKEGLGYIKKSQNLMILFLFAMFINFMSTPMFSVVVPFVMRSTIKFDAVQYGAVEMFFSVGILLGNFALATILSKRESKKIIKSGLLFQTSYFLATSVIMFPAVIMFLNGPSVAMFGLFSLSMAIMGFFNALINTPLMTIMQKLIPADMRSRVFSVLDFMGQIAVPWGIFIVGMLSDKIGVHYIYLVDNIIVFFVVMLFIFSGKEEILSDEPSPVQASK